MSVSPLGQLFRTNKLIPAKIRFWAYAEPMPSGCWEWQGPIISSGPSKGYAYFSVKSKYVRVIVWAYNYLIGPIPEGLELDHLCRNRSCVNPWHTEPVTHLINVQRGGAKKSVCSRGHKLEHPNLVYDGLYKGRERYRCKACVQIKARLRHPLREKICVRGHPLQHPNLITAGIVNGHIQYRCRICTRLHSMIHNIKRRFDNARSF
jgi:hypothetical protein